jgi:dipeptidyl-peptidase-3
LEIYKSCEGNWPELASGVGIEIEELRRFLDYAAVFLGNIGNYFVSYSTFTFSLV